jgi:phage/plasmid-like protein (TIGR03299 family)
MAAEFESGMYVNSEGVPWHGLGVAVDGPATSAEAIRAAGLDWTVRRAPLFAHWTGPDEDVLRIDSHVAIVREMDKRRLGVVGAKYQPVQNLEAFTFMDELAGEQSIRYHTAGSLRGGQRVWILAKFDSADIVPGDCVDKYLMLYNSHDGSSALRVLFTNVRVVCMNTARMALQEGVGEGLAVRHTLNLASRLKAARDVLGIARVQSAEFNEFARALANLPLNAHKLQAFVTALVPIDDAKQAGRTIARQNDLKALFEAGRGNDLPGVRGTAWAAYNAVTEYTTWKQASRGTEAERQASRFESALFGAGASMVARATGLLTDLLKAA